MDKQVSKKHYEFSHYINKRRWASIWHQLDEVLKLKPRTTLEIGPGSGTFKLLASNFGVKVETLDIDPDLEPDHLASVFNMPFEPDHFDLVCAFQMLEHLPFQESKQAFAEMLRVAKTGIIISLPDAAKRLPILMYLPKFGALNLSFTLPRLRPQPHHFDGEHYWEINKKDYPLRFIIDELESTGAKLTNTFRVPETPYHRFFIFKKLSC